MNEFNNSLFNIFMNWNISKHPQNIAPLYDCFFNKMYNEDIHCVLIYS